MASGDDAPATRISYDGGMFHDRSPVAGRALVLAGGGLVGIGWEVGVMLGLRDGGVATDDWDRIVGTSAGAVVGAALGSPDGLDRLESTDWGAIGDELRAHLAQIDHSAVARIDELWFGPPDGADQAVRAEIGRLARASTLGPAERFERAMAFLLPSLRWPAGLMVTAVDADDGSLRVFDAGSGIPLAVAVAASCSVPGIFPPVAIDGHLYVDGGVRSGSSLDLAIGCGIVVAVAPTRTDEHGERQIEREVSDLRAAGAEIVRIRPTPGTESVLVVDSLDSANMPAAIAAGREAGREAAGTVGSAVPS